MNETDRPAGLPPIPPVIPGGSEPDLKRESDEDSGHPFLKEASAAISKALSVVFVYLLTQFGVSAILSAGISMLDSVLWAGMYSLNEWNGTFGLNGIVNMVSMVTYIISPLVSGLIAAAYGLYVFRIPAKAMFRKTGWSSADLIRECSSMYALKIPLVLAVLGLSFFCELLFGAGIPSQGLIEDQSVFGTFVNLVLALIIAPVLEEIIFRGVLITGLKKYSGWFAVLFSSLCFGMMHMNLFQGIPVFGIGLVLGYTYLKTDCLPLTMAAHLLNNLLALILSNEAFAFLAWIELVLFFLGWYFISRNWDSIYDTAVSQDSVQNSLWKITSRKGLFWVFVILFILMSVLSVFIYS